MHTQRSRVGYMIHVLESVLKMLHFVTVFQWIKNANSEPKPQNLISKTNMVHLHSLFWRECLIYNGYFRTKESSLKTSGFKKLFQSLNQCRITFFGYSVNMIYRVATKFCYDTIDFLLSYGRNKTYWLPCKVLLESFIIYLS